MLLLVMVVGIVNPNMPFHDEYKQRIQTLFEAGLEKEIEKPESNSSTPPSTPKSTSARATR